MLVLVRKLHPSWLAPVALLLVTVFSYGLWIPWLGLYGNDVPYMWYYHLLGAWGPGLFASIDRPVSALFYAAVTALLGENTWLYHLLLLVLRWLSGVLLWWVIRLVWPGRSREAILTALLFVVYPGFRQNPVSLEFILHIAVLDLFLVSLGSMLMAVIRPGRQIFWLVISAVTAGSIFFLEYFIGLEILRPIFLWILLRGRGLPLRKSWLSIIRAWLPALVVVLAFVVWRVFIFEFRGYQPVLLDTLRASPVQGILQLGEVIARDLTTSLIRAWMLVMQVPDSPRRLIAFVGVAGLGAAVAGFALWQVRNTVSQTPVVPHSRPDYWGETAFVIGLVCMLASGIVFWVTGIPVSTEFPWDRSTLSFMLGASLVGAGLLEMLVSSRYRWVVAAVLVGLAVGSHFQNAVVYNQEWKKLQSFFWQLSWRAPGLETGTLILFDVIPLNRYSDSDLTALLNWTYAPALESRLIPYKFFDLTIRLGTQYAGLPGLERDLLVEHDHRGLFFSTTTSHMLAVHYNPPGCLQVLSPQDARLPGLPDRLVSALPIVELSQIQTGAEQAYPPDALGTEPAHDWCYYYQKAELARQQEDWEGISRLSEAAFQRISDWNEPYELLPFIEGLAYAGNFDKARELTVEANTKPGYQPVLCDTWKQIGTKQDGESQAAASSLQTELGCTP